MRLLILSSFIFISLCLHAQEQVLIKNGQAYDSSKFSKLVQNLHDQNEFVILFRTLIPDSVSDKYFILTQSSNQFVAFELEPYTENKLPRKISQENLLMIWKNLLQNEIFSLRNEKELSNFCALKYDIYDSYTYEFTILSKSSMKVLSYYNPEYYDEVCYGLSERKKIINAASAFAFYWK